ncbi:MAG: hypothetical protein J7M10_07530 [Candidatus Cloacimonetes bacterium]|nr:hypothetical protein [Candidatus Cloacimonadota bacterium]
MKQKNRTTLFVVLAVFVVIIVVYFSFFYPLPSSKNLTGTMIGIEKSKREIGDQITIEEIIIENPEINDVIQSAEFQNLIKDKNFRKMALSSDFQNFVFLMSDFQRIALFSHDFQNIVPVLSTPEEFKNFIESDEFKKGFSVDFQKAVLAMPQDQINAVLSQDFNENNFFNAVIVSAINSGDIVFSENFVNSILSNEFQESIKDIDFANPSLASFFSDEHLKSVLMISDDNIEALKSIYSNENFGAVLFNQDFITIIKALDFQNQFM